MLRYAGVKVVLNHRHNSRSLLGTGGVLVDGTGVDVVGRAVAVHIDAAVVLQLLRELGRESGVQLGGEIAQGVLEGKHFLLVGEDVFALGGVVDTRVVRLGFGQGGAYAC